MWDLQTYLNVFLRLFDAILKVGDHLSVYCVILNTHA